MVLSEFKAFLIKQQLKLKVEAVIEDVSKIMSFSLICIAGSISEENR